MAGIFIESKGDSESVYSFLFLVSFSFTFY